MHLAGLALEAYLLVCVSRLGCPNFRARESAHRALASTGRFAQPALEFASTRHGDPEVRARCQGLLSPYALEIAYREALKVRPRNWPRVPWLSLWSGSGDWVVANSDSMNHYLALSGYRNDAREVATHGDYYGSYRRATVYWLRDQILGKRDLESIRDDLDRMANEELEWIRANNLKQLLPRGYQ